PPPCIAQHFTTRRSSDLTIRVMDGARDYWLRNAHVLTKPGDSTDSLCLHHGSAIHGRNVSAPNDKCDNSPVLNGAPVVKTKGIGDRKSTRLNSSHGSISY